MTDKKTDPAGKSAYDRWPEGYGNELMMDMWREDNRTVEQMLTEGIMPKGYKKARAPESE